MSEGVKGLIVLFLCLLRVYVCVHRKESQAMEAQIKQAERDVAQAQNELAGVSEALGKAVAAAEEVRAAHPAGCALFYCVVFCCVLFG